MDMQKILRDVKPVDVVRCHLLIGYEISHYIHYSLLARWLYFDDQLILD